MTDSRTSTTEAAIVGRLMKPDKGDFSPEAARELLGLRFGETDQRRMGELSLKSQEGKLSSAEEGEVESYRRVGYWLGVLWSRARLSLKNASMDARDERRP